MAFVNRLAILAPGYGSAISNDSQNLKQNVALSTTGQQTNTFPASGGLAPAPRSGQVRVKIYNGGGTTPAAAIIVQFTDGTNTVIVFNQPAVTVAATAAGGMDFVIDFLLDIVPTSMSILTTLTGTTPTATMDAEIAYSN